MKSQFSMTSQHGVTMIEALVSMLLFSVGALGLAAMQFSAMSTSGDNLQRSVAIWKAQEFADRIRSNPDLASDYVKAIGNTNANKTLGVDSPANVIVCGAGGTAYAPPAARCADYIDAQGNPQAGAVCTDLQQVDFDIWDVFCEPSTGAAVAGTAAAQANQGSVGLTNLEVVLREPVLGGDLELYFEWLSREGEATAAELGTANIGAELCGLDANGDGNVDVVNVDPRLDVYCLRFRP